MAKGSAIDEVQKTVELKGFGTVAGSLMRDLGDASSTSLENKIDSSLLDECNVIESALDAEIDAIPLEFSPHSRNSATRLESDSIEALNPLNAHPLSIEDPIVTYDSVVNQMITNGVEWIPPDQMGKEFSDVRLVHPIADHSQNINGSDNVTTSTVALSEVTLNNGCQTPRPTKPTDPSNNIPSIVNHYLLFTLKYETTAFVQHPSSDTNDLGVSENVSKLRELQFQLNQEKATRKHQEDYIQQLQRYYDNLLAKHAAAEMTIDHLRFRAKVGCDDSTPLPTLPTTPSNTSFNTLRGRKLTSVSLDTCVPASLSKRPHQPHVSGSVISLRDKSTPTLLYGSPSYNQRASMQPQVHLMPLSSSICHSEQNHLNDGFECSKSSPNNTTNGNNTASSGDDGADFDGVSHRPVANVNLATQEAAKSLEDQLNASLAAVHERLNAIEARPFDDHREEAIAAAHRDLEDLQRRYQAGQYLWSGGGLFDSQAMIGSRLDRLSQRLQLVLECTLGDDDDNTTPPRPSSLSLVDSHRSASANTNYTVVPTTATGINSSGPAASYHESSSSPSGSARPGAADAATIAASADSLEAAEAHFSRLLTRYNKLKTIPGHWKNVESLMQRMLQLSDRYSAQSSVIFPPKNLRQMFESDYGINNGVNQALTAKPFVQTYSQSIVSKPIKDAPTNPQQMVSPDSGVAQTPLGSSGSSGISCYGTAVPRGGLVRQRSTEAAVAPLNEASIDLQRKQSDSGFWATDTCSAAAPPSSSPFKGGLVNSLSDTTTNTDELDVDDNVNRLSKMLPGDVMSLEADILRLRKGIARLTSTASGSASRHRESGAGSGSSNSTFGENPSRKTLQRPLNGVNASTLSRLPKSLGHSSTNVRQLRLPASSSSSDEDTTYSTYNRSRHPSKSRHHVAALNNSNDTNPSLKVIGSSLIPHQRTPAAGPTRTYCRTSSRTHPRSSRIEDPCYHRIATPGHRRSRSSTGQKAFYRPCGSCGGSGYNLNTVGRSENEAFDSLVHSRTISDSFSMPARVIYEYRQTPTIRLPVQQGYNGWTEQVYGIQELYGSALSLQKGRAYNTIGHQPSTSLGGWSNQSQCSWAPGKSVILPATSSPLIPQRAHRRTRQYVPSKSQSLSHGDTTSSSSEDEACGATVIPTSSCSCNHYRHRSSSCQAAELEDFSSASSGAYAAARCVTQMAQRLNSKLTRHQDRHRAPMRQPQPHQQLSSHRRSSRCSHRDSDTTYREDF
ncbi:rac guanyl nucleotide exchange factor [Echinococcus multilocularis]|uniref:Rac guanyl nucleotide exchange factor n=1 Tax=Echinococcus multilocularis TaxID=6211 RepID=A0A068XU11_ECHMU|nr:rac guanyl nucleotide exchange factor [Echinococcus multilocularis]